jgi:hypothetical protein
VLGTLEIALRQDREDWRCGKVLEVKIVKEGWTSTGARQQFLVASEGATKQGEYWMWRFSTFFGKS